MRKPNNSQKKLSIIISVALLLATLCLSSAVSFSSSSTQPAFVSGVIDLDATDTITPGPGTTYQVAEIWHGGMYLGYCGGTAHYQTLESMNYTLHVVYTTGTLLNLLVAIALKRNSSQTGYAETQYPNATQVILSPGQGFTWIANWSENGVDQVVLADNAYPNRPGYPDSGHHGTLYTIGIEASPVNGLDTNVANNYAAYSTPWNASRLIGDIRQDGIVDILGCIKFSMAWGTTSTSRNWNADADIHADGIIDLLDAIPVMMAFGKHVP